MGWDGVPWLVGGGAKVSAEMARVLAYAAVNGNEGIMGPDDLKVTALAVPGGSVNVAPGACSIICRASGQSYQAYIERMTSQDTVDIAPTDSSGGRSDMVVARVEDPYLAGEPWQPPTDPTVGPYIFSRVIPNVPPTAKTVTELGLGYTAIPLARIDIPASTGTFTDAMIVDLRQVANPRKERQLLTVVPTAQETLTTTAGFQQWPNAAVFTVTVPVWATKAVVISKLVGVRFDYGDYDANMRANLGGLLTAAPFKDNNYIGTSGANPYRVDWEAGGTLTIPASMRGTQQTLTVEIQNDYQVNNSQAVIDASSFILHDIEWQETAA